MKDLLGQVIRDGSLVTFISPYTPTYEIKFGILIDIKNLLVVPIKRVLKENELIDVEIEDQLKLDSINNLIMLRGDVIQDKQFKTLIDKVRLEI